MAPAAWPTLGEASAAGEPQLPLVCGVSDVVRRFLPLLALVLTSALLAAPSAGAAPPKVPHGFYGTAFDGFVSVAHYRVQDAQFGLMARSGVESARVVFPWEKMQPVERGAVDFSSTDITVAAAAYHGIDVLPTVIYAPYWARLDSTRVLSPPKRNSDYTAFLDALIRRYGPRGSFWRDYPGAPRRPIRSWQIWNEPNIRPFWDVPVGSKHAWPQGYGSLLRAANATIKRADPGGRTVFAGLTAVAWKDLRNAYKRGGIRKHFDVAALQIYTQSEQRELEAVRRLRRELVRAGDKKVRMFVTEVAFPASKGHVRGIRGQRQETPKGMARRLSGTYALLARQRKRFLLDKVFWYTWASRYGGRGPSIFNFSGLIRTQNGEVYTAQPALGAFRRSAQRRQGCVKTSRGRCR